MMNSLATAAFILLLSGAAIAQQKQPQRTTKSANATKKTGTISSTDAVRSDPSAANTHDGTMGVSTGTGTTFEQNQASRVSGTGTTATDPASSVRTSAPNTKPKKKAPKSGNQ